MAISITEEQLLELSNTILRWNHIAPADFGFVLATHLKGYLETKEYEIDAAPFTKEAEGYEDFFICFLGNFAVRDGQLVIFEETLRNSLKEYAEKKSDKSETHVLLERNRDLRDLILAGEKVSPNYWCTDSDIDNALDHILKKHPGKREHVAKAVPFEEERIKAEIESKTPPVFIPVNRGRNHWVRIAIDINGDVSYVDPLSGSDENKRATAEQLGKMFPGKKVDVQFTAKQDEPLPYTCGDRAIVQIVVDTEVTHPIREAKTAETIRRELLNVMTDLTGKEVKLASSSKVEKKEAKLTVPKKEAADKNGKWNNHSVQKVKETFQEVFKGVKAELVDDTIKTTDLSDDNLKVLVEKTKALMDKLGLKGSVEINVSPETKRSQLEELCRKHKLEFTSNAKEAESAPAVAERSAVRPGG